MTTTPTDIDALKERLRATWASGDFGVIAHAVAKFQEELVGQLGITSGMKVLDVACGTGNSAIPAARLGADVIGIDIAANLIEQAKARAAAEGVQARFQEGDAEHIEFPDGSFDLVISIFGAMFAPRPDLTASELKRVTKSGGRIVMGNWTPAGFAGESFKLTAKYAPPPPGMVPPVLWGDEATVRERLQAGISKLEIRRVTTNLAFPMAPEETVQLFIDYFGPTKRTYESLDPAGQASYRKELTDLYRQHNQAKDGTTSVESELLVIIATRA
jgi:ubiquinone/menaquinone biosynthesis C-methylase UbiE